MLKQLIPIVSLSLIVTVGCKKELQNPNQSSRSQLNMSQYARQGIDNPEGEVVLGEQLENPYTPENMQSAILALENRGIVAPADFNVHTSHKYIKFTPTNWEDYAVLREDTSHVYFDHPLDREIEVEGNRYHDPNVADSLPSPLYTTFAANEDITTDIPYEVISPLYIPELDPTLEDNIQFMDELLDQAYVQTNNFNDTIKAPLDPTTFARTYRPGGQILINDNRINQNYGMEGVLITARRWFTIFKGRPDFNGNYLVNGIFNRPCNYRLHFEAPGFNVRESFFNVIAFIDGPKSDNPWSTTIGQGYNNFVGHIFRGAYRYHFKNIDGLLRPIHPSLHFTNYIAKDAGNTWFGMGVNYGVIPIIKVARFDNNNTEFMDDAIFSTTCHETAHLTHIILLNNNLAAFMSVGGKIRESWATAVEWWLSGMEYRMRGVANYGQFDDVVSTEFPNRNGYQYWGQPNSDPQYTSLFINCLDTYIEQNQNVPGWGLGVVNDRIGAMVVHTYANPYTIQNLELWVIKYSVDLTTTSNSLKAHKPAGVTNQIIDNLISFY